MRYLCSVGLVLLGHCLAGGVGTAFAQGLIWNLPKEDGTWVRYEGTFKQVEVRAESNEANLTLDWLRQLWIKSVGTEKWKYDETNKSWAKSDDGEPCRWVEIKLVTGKPSETGIDPGPVGARIYKVLVPESRIKGKVFDAKKIHVSYIPIVKGYRRIGNGEVLPLKAGVLQVYPLLSMLMHYKTLESQSQDGLDPEIPLQKPVTAWEFKGTYKMESRIDRSVNEAKLWLSNEIPFGLAKWTVEMSREAKDAREPRSEFQLMSKVTVTMSAHEMGTDAQSELPTPAAGQ